MTSLLDDASPLAEQLRELADVLEQLDTLERRLEALRLQAMDALDGMTARNGTLSRKPHNVELRNWNRYRAYFQRLERLVRRDMHMEPDDRVTKNMITAVGGPPSRTIYRTMRGYGLRVDQWPPSTWPLDAPRPML